MWIFHVHQCYSLQIRRVPFAVWERHHFWSTRTRPRIWDSQHQVSLFWKDLFGSAHTVPSCLSRGLSTISELLVNTIMLFSFGSFLSEGSCEMVYCFSLYFVYSRPVTDESSAWITTLAIWLKFLSEEWKWELVRQCIIPLRTFISHFWKAFCAGFCRCGKRVFQYLCKDRWVVFQIKHHISSIFWFVVKMKSAVILSHQETRLNAVCSFWYATAHANKSTWKDFGWLVWGVRKQGCGRLLWVGQVAICKLLMIWSVVFT